MHVTPEKKMGSEHLIRHMGEFSIFVPFVGVFVCIVILIVCCSKGRRGKTSSDIESKVLSGELSYYNRYFSNVFNLTFHHRIAAQCFHKRGVLFKLHDG